MKRSFALLLAALTVLTLSIGLLGCKKEAAAPKHNSEFFGNYSLDGSTTIQLRTSSKNLYVYDETGEKRLQTISWNSEEPENAKKSLLVFDANGDKLSDILFTYRELDGNSYKMLYLYSAAKEEFVVCKGFEALPSPKIDIEAHLITTVIPGVAGCYMDQYYTFSGTDLITGSSILRDGEKAALSIAVDQGIEAAGATIQSKHFKQSNGESLSLYTLTAADGSFLCRVGLNMGGKTGYFSTEPRGDLKAVVSAD